MEQLTINHWALLALGAVFTGLGKGGLPGAGNLTVAIFALVLEDALGPGGVPLSVGILLPVLIAADIAAVLIYRRHAEWKFIARLLPFFLVGIGVGSLHLGIIFGPMGGIATMLANAAGPVAQLYLLAMALPKYAFIGTAAWLFLIVNVAKVPFMVDLNIINGDWLKLSFQMMPFAVVATIIAPYIVKHINQKLFETLLWVFVIFAGVKLLL